MSKFYRVKATEPFLKGIFSFLSKNERIKFNKFKNRLRRNPYLGDTLRVNYVREFKTSSGKRVYFLVYEDITLILFVAYSKKKNQQEIIEKIFDKLDSFKELVYLNYKS